MIKDRIDSMFVQARFYFNLEKYSSALRIYSKIINYFENYDKVLDSSYRDRYFARVCYKKALTLYYLNRYEESVEYYNKAININPIYEKAFINKGIILAKLMVFDEALEAFNAAIEINERSEISYFNIGIIYSKLERYEDALSSFNKAAELGYDYAYLNVAIILERLGRIDEAFNIYDKAISINKSLEVIYLNKAGLLVNIGKYQEAIKYLDKALSILEDKNSKGDTIIKNKEHIEYMEMAIIEDDTIYDRIYFLKSDALINLSQYDYALTLLLNIKESSSVNIFYIISRFIEYIPIEKLINIILGEDSFWVEEKEEYFNFIVKDIENKDRTRLKKLWIMQYVFLYLVSVKDYDKINEISHYTSIEVFNEMAFDRRYDNIKELYQDENNISLKKNKLRMTSVKNANDPKEGKILMQLLRNNNVNSKYANINSFIALQTSFSRCKDSLTMYRLYGKYDNKEGTGCCLVFDKSFFDTSFNNRGSGILFSFSYDKNNYSNIEFYEEQTLPLYFVLYYNFKRNEIVFNPCESDYDNLIIDLNKNYSVWNYGDKFYDKLKNNIGYVFCSIFNTIKTFNAEEISLSYQLLMNIQYLIKDSSFIEEQEMRIIQLVEYGSNPLHIDNEMKRSYKNYLYIFDNKALKEVILAPKVKDADFLVEKFNDRLAKATSIYNSKNIKNKYKINVYISNSPIS
ncbi:tetratricopeptide repeat protein [Brachyspira alvinipulli]|uniref:tetratricopeptide repeat protein n=1 Tax=Brachyspira alvinipulli TaxID=84379 RepID=UPI000485A7E8|nr:tetratricopeptide repeat protein [Brachyspira alvinipulli]